METKTVPQLMDSSIRPPSRTDPSLMKDDEGSNRKENGISGWDELWRMHLRSLRARVRPDQHQNPVAEGGKVMSGPNKPSTASQLATTMAVKVLTGPGQDEEDPPQAHSNSLQRMLVSYISKIGVY